MGEGATFKRGDLRISWSDNDDSTTAFFQEPGWSQMQLPVLLSVFALIGGLGLSLVVSILNHVRQKLNSQVFLKFVHRGFQTRFCGDQLYVD